MGSIGRDPIFVARGEGAELIDVDGNRYVDWMMSWGPLIAGHADPEVIEAVSAAAAAGTSFGAPTEAEVELAAEVVDRVPSAEMVRMTSSGTEASMSALRLARAATGRDRILEVRRRLPRPRRRPAGRSGVRARDRGHPLLARGNRGAGGGHDHRSLERPRGAAGRESSRPSSASPIRPTWGSCRPREGFLAKLRELADETGSLLVFDEVISGFRVARGGAQEREGVIPDLTSWARSSAAACRPRPTPGRAT